MPQLANSDLEKLLHCCFQIYQWESSPDFGSHVVKILPQLVDAAVAVHQSFDFTNGTSEMAMSEPMPALTEHIDAFMRNMHEHPLINHSKKGPDPRALRISDLVATNEFRKTGLYNEFFRKIQLPYQIAMGLPTKKGDVLGVVYSRDEEFTDNEKQLLELFRVHIIQAKKQAQRCRHLLNYARRAKGMLESLREGIVSLDNDLRVRQRTVRAVEIFARHFPVAPESRRKYLPEIIRKWIAEQTEKNHRASHHPYKTRRQILIPTEQGGVRVELIHADPGYTLIVEERGGKWEAAHLDTLGLTEREAEILMWICQGKNNPEIAIIVGAGVRTIEKHVERILKKLNVESRGAAALRAVELLF